MATQVEDLVLLRVDEECAKLQADGRYLEALDYMERSLVLRRCLYGNDSEEAIKSCKQVVDTCNGLATAYLTQDNFQMAMELIKKAEALSEPYEFLRAVTYNNLACYYRRQNKLRTALKYLEKALKLSSRHTDIVNRASTHLNLCAVLSQLGRHSVALEQAQSALILLQEQLFSQVVAPMRTGRAGPNLPELADKVAVLAIAYHNAGVEQEYLKRYEAALESYSKAAELADVHLGPDHEIARTLNTSREAAQKQITNKAMAPARGGNEFGPSISDDMTGSRPASRASRPSTSPMVANGSANESLREVGIPNVWPTQQLPPAGPGGGYPMISPRDALENGGYVVDG